MKQGTAAKVAIVTATAILLAAGVVRTYIYTAEPVTTMTAVLPHGTSSVGGTSQSATPGCGDQDVSGQPRGCWGRYLGFLPSGYSLAPKNCVNCPSILCPPGLNLNECKQFQTSCGNGVCDPNESCSTCTIDCLPGQLVCSLYLGRAEAPTGVFIDVCQVTPKAAVE
jgi:hypothetical protein